MSISPCVRSLFDLPVEQLTIQQNGSTYACHDVDFIHAAHGLMMVLGKGQCLTFFAIVDFYYFSLVLMINHTCTSYKRIAEFSGHDAFHKL